ncbi:unnamed protein product, partial [Closterium sp. Naga37s-1]
HSAATPFPLSHSPPQSSATNPFPSSLSHPQRPPLHTRTVASGWVTGSDGGRKGRDPSPTLPWPPGPAPRHVPSFLHPLCSLAGSSPRPRELPFCPSPHPRVLAFVPARLVHPPILPRLSPAAATSLATATKMRPSPAAADPRARARPRHLPFPAAACRAASEIPRPSSSPTAPAGRLSTPPRFAPLAAGRAFPPNWALPRVPLPAASSDWMRVARPLRLPCASPACLAILRRLRPRLPAPAARRVREG